MWSYQTVTFDLKNGDALGIHLGMNKLCLIQVVYNRWGSASLGNLAMVHPTRRCFTGYTFPFFSKV